MLCTKEDNVGVVIAASPMVGPLRQCIWLFHGFPWSVRKEEVKLQEIERPPGLSSIELFCCHEVLKVFVVHPYLELVFGTFNIDVTVIIKKAVVFQPFS